MNTIPKGGIGNSAMAGGNERVIQYVIHKGYVKEWVGIGWIEIRKATDADEERYPTVGTPGTPIAGD